MNRLHRGDHAQLTEAWNIGQRKMLGVLHAPAQVFLFRMRLERLFKKIERLAIGAIAEKPELLGRTLIFVGLAEGIVIYGLIVSFIILRG